MAKKSDRKAARAHKARLKKQAGYSAENRAKNKAKGRPERDDVAGAALRFLLNSTVEHPDRASGWTAALARDLARQKVPFDPAETAAVFEAMVERHRKAVEPTARKRAAERGGGE